MPKRALWVTTYKAITDPAKLAQYASVGAPAILAGGGRFVVRGMPSAVFEKGLMERTVVIEFPSVAAAIATYDSPEYRKALTLLDGGCEREIRICEMVE